MDASRLLAFALATLSLTAAPAAVGKSRPDGCNAVEFPAMIKAELPRWARVVKDSGATVD